MAKQKATSKKRNVRVDAIGQLHVQDRKSTRLNSSQTCALQEEINYGKDKSNI